MHPVIVIVKGANWVGAKLTELILEQKAHVVVVDDYTEKTIPFVKRFSDNKNFVFIEKDKIHTLKDNFTKIKYFIHLKHDFDTSDDKVSSKQFLSETKFIDEVLSLAVEKESTYLLTSSIHLHKDFLLKKGLTRHHTKDAYNESDLQDFIEKTVLEYVAKAKLDGRIVRLGNIYGPEMDLATDPLLKQILTDAIYEERIRIYGDGLEYMYYVYINDAIQGIIKALFKHETKGKIYAITNADEISVLTIVNKILALNPTAHSIKFVRRRNAVDPLYQKAYIPDDNLSEIGWKANVSFDRGIAQVFEYFKKDVSLRNYSEKNHATAVAEPAHPTPQQITEPSIRFDDTVNLSDTLAAHDAHRDEDTTQFRNFYEKLHSDDSPIYNRHKESSNVRVGEKQPKHKKSYARHVAQVAALVAIYIFLAAPLFQVSALYFEMKTSAKDLNTFIASGFRGEYKETQLSSKAKTNLVGARWMATLFGKKEYESNVISIAKGIDDASLASKSISKAKLNQYMLLNNKLPEGSVSQAEEVLILLNSARTHLENSDRINLYFGSKEEVQALKQWTYETESKLSQALNYTNNLAGSNNNVLGVEDEGSTQNQK